MYVSRFLAGRHMHNPVEYLFVLSYFSFTTVQQIRLI